MELGIFFLTNKKPTKHLLQHESGHAIQNCYLGFLMPFLVCIPSALRYWYRELKYNRQNVKPPTKYEDIWFEGQATKLGQKYFAEMRQIFIDIWDKNVHNKLETYLSMGMSDSYTAALSAGSDMIRVGSTLFGARIYPEAINTSMKK